MTNELRIGDTILWAGSWGNEPYKEATIETIEIDCEHGEGSKVSSVDWEAVVDRTVTVVLDNNHWAYGFQIKPLEKVVT